jgi:hypothetical protein
MHAGGEKFLAGAGHAPAGHPQEESHGPGRNFGFTAKPLQIHVFLLIRKPKVQIPGATWPVDVPCIETDDEAAG